VGDLVLTPKLECGVGFFQLIIVILELCT